MLKLISEQNCAIVEQLIQDYEEEFAPLTGKSKQPNGKYSIDVDWRPPNIGYVWEENKQIMGFVIKDQWEEYSDIGEFYVSPLYRKLGVGKKMAFSIFNQFPGLWQVRQMHNAELAQLFWRKVIREYTQGAYTEIELEDPVWGRVYCQRFESKK